MMKQWHRELQDVGLKPEYLRKLKNDGVEQFIRMWARSENKSSEGTQIPRQVFANDLVDGRTCEEDFELPQGRVLCCRYPGRDAEKCRPKRDVGASARALDSVCPTGARLAYAPGRTNVRGTPIVRMASFAAIRSPAGAGQSAAGARQSLYQGAAMRRRDDAPGAAVRTPMSVRRVRIAAAAVCGDPIGSKRSCKVAAGARKSVHYGRQCGDGTVRLGPLCGRR